MADYADTMHARWKADEDLRMADAYGGSIEDGRTSDTALAVLLAARAVCSELRVLSVTLDYCFSAHTPATGRP